MAPNEPDFPEGYFDGLDELHQQYDPEWQLLETEPTYPWTEVRHFASPSRLSSGSVHVLRQSLTYAHFLLDTGAPDLIERATEIIPVVLDYQDSDPASDWYGVWPWYAEESLEEMRSVDMNWAAFFGTILHSILLEHGDTLPTGLRDRIRTALSDAAYGIKKRDLGPGYTNVALMSICVAIVAGQELDDEELLAYGESKLQEFRTYTRYHGGFTEYNSPEYAIINVVETGRMRRYFQARSHQDLATDLHGVAWDHFATTYHAPTGQIAGPHVRFYDTTLSGGQRSLVETVIARGLGEEWDMTQVSLVDDHQYLAFPRIDLECPSDLRTAFVDHSPDRFETRQFFAGSAVVPSALEARTYLTESYSLGSFTKADFWHQRRPIVAYWGDGEEPTYLRVRLMKDGYDYASGVLATAQIDSSLVSIAGLATDHGEYDLSMGKPPGGVVSAEELVLRFELGGRIDDVSIPSEPSISEETRIDGGDVDVSVDVLHAGFDSESIHVESGSGVSHPEQRAAWLDVVLYRGPERTIDPTAMDRMAIAFGLTIGAEGRTANYGLTDSGGTLRGTLRTETRETTVEAPLSPRRFDEWLRRTRIDDTEVLNGEEIPWRDGPHKY